VIAEMVVPLTTTETPAIGCPVVAAVTTPVTCVASCAPAAEGIDPMIPSATRIPHK
jgi:hypothetical protein